MEHKDNEYIFTFGFGQGYDNGFVVVEANSFGEAREEMVKRYGERWCSQYEPPNAREKAGVDKWGMWEVKEQL